MPINRRTALTAFTTAAVGSAVPAAAGRREDRSRRAPLHDTRSAVHAGEFGVKAGRTRDQTVALQAAIDAAATRDLPLVLPPGRIVVGRLKLRSHSDLVGSRGATTLSLVGKRAGLEARSANTLRLRDVILDAAAAQQTADRATVALIDCTNVVLQGVTITNTPGTGASLKGCSGQLADCTFENIGDAGIFSIDARGLTLRGNTITRCANNGILVWRSAPGADRTLVTANRISHVNSVSGGTGQNGNGINAFRADNVIISNNHITDCAYSAVRANSASNIQIVTNNCARLGEVALYAEFAFQGAVIANNIVDTSATGISVTNFNDGGRLATVHGNVIRNLFRREQEPVDKRGVGISVEADTTVSGNTIEGAPTAGITIGWHRFMRNVAATGNVVRDCRVGVAVSGSIEAGHAIVASNVFQATPHGAVRAARGDQPIGHDLTTSGVVAGRGNLVVRGNVVS